MALNLSLPTLASGSFSTGPSDAVATVDVYAKSFGAEGQAVLNSIQGMSGGLGSGLMDLISGGVGSLTDFLSVKDSIMSFDPKKLTERVLNTSTNLRGAIGSLGGDIMSKVNMNTFMDKANGIMCTVGDVRSMVDKAQVNTMGQLGSFINDYTGSSVYNPKDNAALGGLLGGVIGKASDLGIGGTFTALTSTITDKGLINKTVKAVLPMALRNSDMRLLDEMARSPAAKLINTISPGFTQQVTSLYRGGGISKQKPLTNWNSMISAFGNVNKQWDKLQKKDGSTVSSIVSLIGGSRDFQQLLVTGVNALDRSDPEYKRKVTYALARNRAAVDPKKLLQKNFQSTALTSIVGKAATMVSDSKFITDPRALKDGIAALFK